MKMRTLADKARSIAIKAINKQNKEEPFPDELYKHFQNMIFDAVKRGDRHVRWVGNLKCEPEYAVDNLIHDFPAVAKRLRKEGFMVVSFDDDTEFIVSILW